MSIKVVTICGSMRFAKEMIKITETLELQKGYAVIQCVYTVDNKRLFEEDSALLDKIHKKKIDISDAIYVVNIGGYIGASTKDEIEYARAHGKQVLYHEAES